MALQPVPMHDRIVVKRDEPKTMSDGGIYLPDKARDQTRTGVVISSGPGQTTPEGVLIPNTLVPGDHIIFGTYAGSEIKLGGQTYQIMREGDVVAMLREGDNVEAEGVASEDVEVSPVSSSTGTPVASHYK